MHTSAACGAWARRAGDVGDASTATQRAFVHPTALARNSPRPQKLRDGTVEGGRLVEIGNVPGTGELDVARSRERLVQFGHGCGGHAVLFPHEKQHRPFHRPYLRSVAVIVERGGTSDEAGARRGA